MSKKKQDGQHTERQRRELLPGVKLLRALEGHDDFVFGVAFDLSGMTGLDDLLRRMREQIPWEQKAATVTTVTFKRI